MNSPAKVILIVFGSLIAAVVALAAILMFVAVPQYEKHLAGGGRDTGTIARVIRELGPFEIPPGYRARSGSDFLFTKTVTLRPRKRSHTGYFWIGVSKTTFPVAAMNTPETDAESAKGREMGLRLGCHSLTILPKENLVTALGAIIIYAYRCDDSKFRVETANALLPTKTGLVQITATASPPTVFDAVTLHLLIAAFR